MLRAGRRRSQMLALASASASFVAALLEKGGDRRGFNRNRADAERQGQRGYENDSTQRGPCDGKLKGMENPDNHGEIEEPPP